MVESMSCGARSAEEEQSCILPQDRVEYVRLRLARLNAVQYIHIAVVSVSAFRISMDEQRDFTRETSV